MEADEQQQRTSTRWKGRRKTLVLVVEEEKRMDCITTYLLFNINIKDMFTHDDEWTVLRPLPRPMAQMDTLRRLALEYLNFAVVASNTIVGVSNRKRTVLLDLECDATADVLSPGPELPEEIIGGTVLIPLGTGVYAIGNRPCRRSPTFQLLLPPSRRVSGRRRASSGAARCGDGWAPASTCGCRSGTPAYSFDTRGGGVAQGGRLGAPH
ncbi:Os02g0830400 [Oryza sativa Japonica Group]|uniref:Os02g0830400 protein n=1 Tax=Oryza sativa subsp. japonica TaxID=39947 RepID=A0A0P0VRM1_ORYSJ|nr:Os02g0830400 [Oryza sativa Japonica Group]